MAGTGVRVRLLGPVEVVVADGPQAVNGLRRRAVLATLALQPGRVVSVDRLLDVVWGDDLPATAANTLQRHVSYLRGVLGEPGSIVARQPGYVLDTGPGSTDVQAAERLLDLARRTTDRNEQVRHLTDAVALWRGPPLADVTGSPWLEEQAEHLVRLRLEAERALAEARLSVGEHARLVPGLERLVREHPFDEHLHAQLMLALYRDGRQGEAVATYRRLRDALRENLGIDPSLRLRDLECAILRQDAAIAAPAPAVAAQEPVAAQLPPSVPTFTGRDAELAALDALVDRGGAVVISGTAGVGKTALAVHWAHRAAERFPDGQLYVNLRGFDPGAAPTEPARALHGFLEALGVPAARMPSDPDAMVSLYRTMVAGRRLLVVLDNARDAEQVRPLLPGSPDCLAIVTSRDQLVPLVVTESAQPVPLGLLSPGEARDLLVRRLGKRQVAAEPGAADEIADRCAGLPIALAVVAARAATNRHFSLAAVAGELSDLDAVAGELSDLDAFHGGDEATDVRAVFSWSCRTLSPPAARLFRLLSLHPGPDVSAPAVASLAGITPQASGPVLTELTRANLFTEHTYGRYAFHDLLRAYAAGLADEAEPPAEREAAVHRLLDHCLHTAHAADLVLHPHFSEISLAPSRAGVTAERPRSKAAATAWFTAELPVLLAAVPLAARSGFEGHAWRLAWAMAGFLHRQGHWQDWLGTQRIALAAASRIGDQAGQGHAHRSLGLACSRLRRHDEADDHLRRAFDLFTAIGDDAGRAHTCLNLGQLAERQGRYQQALSHSRRALALFRGIENRAGQGYTLNAVGWQEALLGNYQRALESCGAALGMLREVDDVQGQADTWDSLGHAHHQLGDDRRAIACYEQALDLFAQVRDRYAEAGTYANLGRSHRALSDVDAARAAWLRALTILDDLGDADAEAIRVELDQLDAARLH
ncbi:BTAD domain-containing putative transcriptional regulator [Micromonospora sp. WMMD1155]|uniref:AfsR/SARP family transcriptional regulator n=1 Tax=Micromonospora sp. WMMD1155 TaxID=3016094 RepID=UPI00249BB8CF|nr:BTAD domain-containing putative transcriptional regulator [Micromonospora sp. WMMD1155]WFE55184.1 BTAD domain-containing putative transcriptional regulator [Micromonospora sp. WMMD1155]